MPWAKMNEIKIKVVKIVPTIEIISLGRKTEIKIPREKYSFRIWQNSELVSHRYLFNEYLSDRKGVILHLANKKCVKTGFWFASDLYDHDFEVYDDVNDEKLRFKFDKEHIEGVRKLLLQAWRLSPLKIAFFLTDYQFGKKPKGFAKMPSLRDFWLLHDEQGLEWNTLYEIY